MDMRILTEIFPLANFLILPVHNIRISWLSEFLDPNEFGPIFTKYDTNLISKFSANGFWLYDKL